MTLLKLPEFALLARQLVVVAALMLLSLVGVRLFAWSSDLAFTLLLIELSVVVVAAAVWSLFVRGWLLFFFGWALGFMALMALGLFVISLLDAGAMERLGPAGIAFLIPIMLGAFAFGIAGLIHLIVRLVRAARNPSKEPL